MLITIKPLGQGRYSAFVEDECIVKSSRVPFLAAARALLERGTDPTTNITMRHEGSNVESLSSTIEAAAKLSVTDTGKTTPRFVRHVPFETGSNDDD